MNEFWTSGDIDCIGICNGEKTEYVVKKIGERLCQIVNQVFDPNGLTYSCLVEEGQEAPTTLNQVLNLLIAKSCETPADVVAGNEEIVYYILPECLQYEEDGDTITQLGLTEMINLLSGRVCTIVSNYESLLSLYNTLNKKVSALYESGLGGGLVPSLTMISGCISATTENIEISIVQGISNIENYLCSLKGVLGENADLQSAIAAQCVGLDSADQLNSPGDPMTDLTGWTSGGPVTLAESHKNLWLAFCDLRASVAGSGGAGTECYPYPVSTFGVTSYDTANIEFEWTFQTLPPGHDGQTGIKISIWEWDGVSKVGAAIISDVGPTSPIVLGVLTATSYTVPNTLLDSEKMYVAEIALEYDVCGDSPVLAVYGQLKEKITTHEIRVSEVVLASDNSLCDGGSYTRKNNRLVIETYNKGTGLLDLVGSAITVKVRFQETICDGTSTTTRTVDLDIPLDGTVDNSINYDYYSEYKDDCSGTCQTVTKDYVCTVSTSLVAGYIDPANTNKC